MRIALGSLLTCCLLATVAFGQTEIEKLQQEHEALTKLLAAREAKFEKDRQALRAENESLRKKHQALRDILNESYEDRIETLANYEQKREPLEQERARLEAELLELASIAPGESSDGEITSYDPKTGEAIINLGARAGVFPGLVFQARGTKQHSYRIVVDKVLGETTSRGIVLDQLTENPSLSGDAIDAKLWRPNRSFGVSLLGNFDLDGDGKSDRQRMGEGIETAGGHLELCVDNSGKTWSLGSSTKSRYIVIGNLGPARTQPEKLTTEIKWAPVFARQYGLIVIDLKEFQKILDLSNTVTEEEKKVQAILQQYREPKLPEVDPLPSDPFRPASPFDDESENNGKLKDPFGDG